VIQPLFIMIILTIVFSQVFRASTPGMSYSVFYITGALIFNFVLEATSLSLQSIVGYAGLIKKVYIPKYIFPLQKCLFAFVNMLFSLIAVAIVYIVLRQPLHATIPLVLYPMLCALVFSFGLGMLLAALEVFFRDIQHLYGILTTAWLYLTPIIYSLTILPDWVQTVLKFNPLVYYVDYARNVMALGTIPDVQQTLICAGFALATLFIGLAVFKRTQDRFILHI
jgi:ABC-2 type transport system permease protein